MNALDFDGFFLPVVLFAFAMSATPGPNNVMLTASGANYGFRRTIPHMLGISVGFLTLIAVVAAGLGALFVTYPPVKTALEVVGAFYLLYLAWRIATAAPKTEVDAGGRPITFLEAAGFQYANPKAWVMAISAVSAFTVSGDAYVISAVAVALTCSLVNLPSISMWAAFGTGIGRLLHTARAWRWFNRVMGGLTAACVVLIVLD